MILLRAVLISVSLLLCSTLSAATTFPRGCEVKGFSYDGRFLVVNETGGQTLFLIQNRDKKPIELRRVENPNVFMSPPLIARLEAEHWGAFASDIQALSFECLLGPSPAGDGTTNSESQDAKKTPTFVDCREVLDVCEYPRVKFALSNMGNYWVSVNKTQHQVIQDTAGKGILLRW